MRFAKSILFCSLSIFTLIVEASPREIKLFSTDTWSQISQIKTQAQVTIFTATDCQHCPAVIEYLSDYKKKNKNLGIRLNIVVMDGLSNEDYLLSAPYYLLADNLYAFNGSSAKIRYAVNSGWRGMTPYVVIHPVGKAPVYVYGKPDDKQLRLMN